MFYLRGYFIWKQKEANCFHDFSFEHQVESLTEELLFITETNSDEEGIQNSKETITKNLFTFMGTKKQR